MSEFCTIKSKKIVNGSGLMHSNDNLITWESDLDVLENGDSMFYHCDALLTFKAKTPNLKNGYSMFGAIQDYGNSSKYATIKLDLDNLENGERMFYHSRAVLIPNRSITGGWQLPKLIKGNRMFQDGYVHVAATESSAWDDTSYLYFPALVNAEYMFNRCSTANSNAFGDNFTNITNCHEMFRLSNIREFVHKDLLPNGPVVNSEIAYLEESSNYRLAQDNGCNVCMSGMFRECLNLQYAYLDLGSNDNSRIYAPQMFYASMSNGGQVHLRDNFEYCVLSADEMFRGCGFRNFTTTSEHNFPQLRSARSMFHHSNLPSLVINSMPVVEDTTLFAYGCSNLQHVSVKAKTIGYGAFANCTTLDSAYLYLGNGTHDFSFLFSGSMGGSGYTMLSSVELHENNNDNIVSDIQSCYCMFADCHYLSSASVANYISFANVANAAGMFNYCYRANYDTIGSFTGSFSENLSNATNMFYYCNALESMPLTYNQMKNIESGSYMFYQCVAMNGTFSDFNDEFPYLTSAVSMFNGCGNVNGTWGSNLPELLYASGMFSYTAIAGFGGNNQTIEMPNVTTTSGMFAYCFDLTNCYLSMPNVTTTRCMFDACSSLHFIDSLNMPELTDSYRMFYGCTALSSVHLENVTDMSYCCEMFGGCNSLGTVLLSCPSVAGGMTYYNWQDCSGMFAGCGDLTISGDNHTAYIFDKATNCERMFALHIWESSSSMSPENYPSLKLEGIGIGSSKMTNITNMFEGRKIKDADTAELIGRVAHYTTLSSSQSMGSIFIEEPSYLDDLDAWTAWNRSEVEEVSGKSYSKIELSMTKGVNIDIALTVYCDTEKYKEYSNPYAPCAIVEGSQYIPDASNWNNNFPSDVIVVTSVHDGYAWNDNLS